MESTTIITLKKGNARLAVDTKGAFIRSWTVGRHVGLYSDPAKPARATHPCGPNFGLLSMAAYGDNLYKAHGSVYSLPRHGFFRDVNWTVQKKTYSSVTLGIESTNGHPNDDHLASYPFFYSATLSVALVANQLRYSLAVTGGGGPAPVDLASHTYHPWEPGLTIEGLSGLEYYNYDEGKDTDNVRRKLKGNDFADPRYRDWHFKNTSRRHFTLRYPISKKEISLQMGGGQLDITPETIVTWTKPTEGQFICLEPVTAEANSFNQIKDVPAFVSLNEKIALSFTLTLRDLGS